MIRVLIIVALVFAAAAGFAWLAERPGEISLVWQGQEIRTSLMFGILVLAVLIALIAFIGAVVRAVLSTPQSIGHFFGARRRAKGYRALTRGMVAVGAGDTRVAQRAARDAGSYLGKDPLVTLLSAQAAQMTGDTASARAAFEGLAAEGDTRLLGLRGLFIEARRQGEHTAARHFAEEAVKAAPRLPWAGEALFAYQTRSGDWDGALATLDINVDNGTVDKQRARRLRAVLNTARAMELEAGNPDDARARAFEAHRLAPDLVPAAALAARLLTRNGEIRRASRTLEATWKQAPHPEIAEAYLGVRPGDAARDRLKRAQKLFDLRPSHPESALVLARTAMEAREWPLARTTLERVLRTHVGERACLLMAELEEGENGDQGRARQWLTRSLIAPADPAWVADGQVFARWLPVSPVSGELDAMEWKAPPERPARFATDMEIAAAAEARFAPVLPDDSSADEDVVDSGGTGRAVSAAAVAPPVSAPSPGNQMSPHQASAAPVVPQQASLPSDSSGGDLGVGHPAGHDFGRHDSGGRGASGPPADHGSGGVGGANQRASGQGTATQQTASRGAVQAVTGAGVLPGAGGSVAVADRARGPVASGGGWGASARTVATPAVGAAPSGRAGTALASVPVPDAVPPIASGYAPEAAVATVPVPVPMADAVVDAPVPGRVLPPSMGIEPSVGGVRHVASSAESAPRSGGISARIGAVSSVSGAVGGAVAGRVSSPQGVVSSDNSAPLPRPLARAPDDPGPDVDEDDDHPPVHPLFHPGRIA